MSKPFPPDDATAFIANFDELKKNFGGICSVTPGEGDGLSSIDLSFEDSDHDNNPSVLPSMPLKGCVIFVDVRAENENRSKAISRELERLGAMIAEKITNIVSHVVFKDGRNNTLKQLKKYPHIHLVSVLWVDSCKNTSARMSENLFPANFPGTHHMPLPMARAKRVKSLQPKTFEEDLNNSAKKEEKKKRRLKKLNKDPETPKDQILCFDSQEYIKSSDLYKMVATPRAIPDTPWILNYINGTQDNDSPSQLDSSLQKEYCVQNKEMNSPDQLSQDFHCRLNFDEAVAENDVPLISLGKSPTMNIKDLKPTKKVAFDTEIPTPLSPIQKLNNSIYEREQSNEVIGDEVAIKEISGLNDGEISSPRTTSRDVQCSITQETLSKNPQPGKSATEIMGGNIENVKIPKKKKKLMSTKTFCFPQEKLISPAKINLSKNEKILKPKSHNVKYLPNRYGCTFTAFDAIHAVENSKKNMREKNTIKFNKPLQTYNKNNRSILDENERSKINANQNSEKHDAISENKENLTTPSKSVSEAKENFIVISEAKENSSIATNSGDVQHLGNLSSELSGEKASQCRRFSRRSSGIDFKANRSFRKALCYKKNKNMKCGNKENQSYDKSMNFTLLHDKRKICEEDCTKQSSDVYIDLEVISGSSDEIPREDDSGISESEEVNETDASVANQSSIIPYQNQNDLKLKMRQEKIKIKPRRSQKIVARSQKIVARSQKIVARSQIECLTGLQESKMKVSLVTTSMHYGEQEYIRAMVKQLGSFTLRNNISSDTTHVVAGGPRRTLNILNAIIRGCWILEPKWVADSVEKGRWLSEDNYEMYSEFPIARVCRINRLRNKTYSHMTLFSRLLPMYLAEVTSPSHEEMMKLIISCGGQLTTSIRKAGVAIGLISCRRKDLSVVTEKWVLDSITNGRIMPTKSYEIQLKRERERSLDY